MIMKKLFIYLFLFAIHFKTNSQAPAFMLSSIGPSSVTGAPMATAINFSSINNCIDVKTGLVVLNGIRNSGEFALSCEISLQINQLGIKMFPNPVETTTKIKLTKNPVMNQYFNVSILNTEGFQIKTFKELGANLFQGITIDLSFLNAGTYVLKVTSEQYIDVVKFIKP